MNSIGGITSYQNKVNYLKHEVEINRGRNIPPPKALLKGAIITFQKNNDGTYVDNDNEKGEIREVNSIKVKVYFDKKNYETKTEKSTIDLKV